MSFWQHSPPRRHSYITYHVREHGDIYQTATAAGNSPGVIKAHHEGAAKSSEAKAFWSITPESLEFSPGIQLKAG